MPDKPTKVIPATERSHTRIDSEHDISVHDFTAQEDRTIFFETRDASATSRVSESKTPGPLSVLPASCLECGRPAMLVHSQLECIALSRNLQNLLQQNPSQPFEDQPETSPETDSGSQGSDAAFQARYLIGEVIGCGGMGSVHRGWDLQLQRCVAIKIIADEHRGKRTLLLRFLREARVASRLLHPGIVKVHDFDVDATGTAFMVMDLLTGRTFDKVLESSREDPGQLPSLLATFLQISQAIAFAHAEGIVHRDLKPSNIMVGDFGVVAVLDWGLAKMLHDRRPCKTGVDWEIENSDDHDEYRHDSGTPIGQGTKEDLLNTGHGTVLGTPHYLAPEQARGEAVNLRADVFALGGILCQILTGKPPFLGDSMREVFDQSVSADLSNAYDMLDHSAAPGPMIALAKHCLAPHPDDRPANARLVVEPLKAFLESGQRRAEQELIRFFELSLDLFCIANMQGYFCRVNDNFSTVLGYATDQLTSCQFIEFVHPDDRESTYAQIDGLSRGEPAIRFRNRYRHRDGHYVWLEWMARSIPSEGSIYAVARVLATKIGDLTLAQCHSPLQVTGNVQVPKP